MPGHDYRRVLRWSRIAPFLAAVRGREQRTGGRVMRRHFSRVVIAVTAVVVVAIAGGVTYAVADIGGSGVINGCYKSQNGQLRLIDPASASCNPSETAISWNQTGPQGPAGPQGSAGPQGPRAGWPEGRHRQRRPRRGDRPGWPRWPDWGRWSNRPGRPAGCYWAAGRNWSGRPAGCARRDVPITRPWRTEHIRHPRRWVRLHRLRAGCHRPRRVLPGIWQQRRYNLVTLDR